MADNRRPVDRGWAWMVCLATLLIQALTLGVIFSFGIIYVDLLKFFKEDRSTTAWIGSIQPALMYATGIVVPAFLKRFGWRVVTGSGAAISAVGFGTSAITPNLYILYLTYGVITGVGFGMMYVTSMVILQHYFDKKRAMATGFGASGTGIGTLIFGLVTPKLLDAIGWRWTLACYAGLCILVGIPCAFIYKPLPEADEDSEAPPESRKENEKSSLIESKDHVCYEAISSKDFSKNLEPNIPQKEDKKKEDQSGCCIGFIGIIKETTDCSLLLNPVFSVFLFAIVMFGFGYNAPYTYTPDRAIQYYKMDPNKAATLISIIGLANVGSRLVFGWAGDKHEVVRHFTLAVVVTLGGLISVVIFLFTTYPTMVIYSVFFGLFAGVFVSLFPVVAVDLVGKANVSRSVGLSLVAGSVGALFAAPLSGWIIDLTGSFDAPFYVVGAAQAFGGLSFLMASLYRYCIKPRIKPTYTEVIQDKESLTTSGMFTSSVSLY